jgi:hypothetical protein
MSGSDADLSDVAGLPRNQAAQGKAAQPSAHAVQGHMGRRFVKAATARILHDVIEEAPRDSYADDAEFTITQPKFRANGRNLKAQEIADSRKTKVKNLIPASAKVSFPFHDFVHMKGGEYFFAPSIGQALGLVMSWLTRRSSSASCAKAIDAGSIWTRRRRSSIRWLSVMPPPLFYGVTVTVALATPWRPLSSVVISVTV